MGCGKHDNHTGCVCEVVQAIKEIQDNAVEETNECNSCFLEPLGAIGDKPKKHQHKADTRVFVLKTADGSPFHAFFRSDHDCPCVSIFFRVEDIFENCCAVLRVLRPIKKTGPTTEETLDIVDDCCIDLSKICKLDDFEATEDCVTVDLSCFCAIQCIDDVFLGL
jgi:hypothetical protein